MIEHATPLGTRIVAPKAEIFRLLAEQMGKVAAEAPDRCVIGLTGGSTPKQHYQWLVETGSLPTAARERAIWSVSDERHVPIDHEESNFGNAARRLLDPLGIPAERRLPWPTGGKAEADARALNHSWEQSFGGNRCFDLCVLGMGDDGHTASLFPGSPLLGAGVMDFFTAVEVPGKGWRLTITEAGLEACGAITIIVTGANKAQRLKAVFTEPAGTYPVQIVRAYAPRVTWLIDDEAGSLLAE